MLSWREMDYNVVFIHIEQAYGVDVVSDRDIDLAAMTLLELLRYIENRGMEGQFRNKSGTE